MNYDKESFLVGLQLGRRLKDLEVKRRVSPPVDSYHLITELGDGMETEDGVLLDTEET